jgi:DNA invertase Pin-like site-specific DNA recombinase
MLVGYARVSTQDQNPTLQIDALRAAGCKKVFVEKASGAQRDRPQLAAALEFTREGADDVLVVWRLDRLARSLSQLSDTMAGLQARGVGFRPLTEAVDTTSPGGRLIFHIFGAIAEFERSINAASPRSESSAGIRLCLEIGWEVCINGISVSPTGRARNALTRKTRERFTRRLTWRWFSLFGDDISG